MEKWLVAGACGAVAELCALSIPLPRKGSEADVCIWERAVCSGPAVFIYEVVVLTVVR